MRLIATVPFLFTFVLSYSILICFYHFLLFRSVPFSSLLFSLDIFYPSVIHLSFYFLFSFSPMSCPSFNFMNLSPPPHSSSYSSLTPSLPSCTAIRADSAFRRQRGMPEDSSPRPAARVTPSDTPASTPQMSPRIRRFSTGHGGAYVTASRFLVFCETFILDFLLSLFLSMAY
jgi:hypothetical protein